MLLNFLEMIFFSSKIKLRSLESKWVKGLEIVVNFLINF